MILERIDKRASILIIAILVFLDINRFILLHILKWHYESVMYERSFEFDLELLLSAIIVFLLIFISIRSTQIHEKLVFSGLALWFCISLFEVFIEELIPSLSADSSLRASPILTMNWLGSKPSGDTTGDGNIETGNPVKAAKD